MFYVYVLRSLKDNEAPRAKAHGIFSTSKDSCFIPKLKFGDFAEKFNKYYFGQTNDPIRRVNLHNSGKVKSTRFRRPLILLGYKTFEARNDARWYEYNLKHHGDRKKKLLKELKVL